VLGVVRLGACLVAVVTSECSVELRMAA